MPYSAWNSRYHTDTPAVMEGYPGRSGGGVERGVEDRPVGDGVRAVGHGLGLPVGGGHAARIQVVPTNDDGHIYLP